MAEKELRLRPHHIFCGRFLDLDSPERSEAFRSFEQELRYILNSDYEEFIEIIQGIDKLCNLCLHCKNGRCESPHGNEEKVRKWDEIILSGLGMSYGDKETNLGLKKIIESKAPLALCKTKCPYQKVCHVFELSNS